MLRPWQRYLKIFVSLCQTCYICTRSETEYTCTVSYNSCDYEVKKCLIQQWDTNNAFFGDKMTVMTNGMTGMSCISLYWLSWLQSTKINTFSHVSRINLWSRALFITHTCKKWDFLTNSPYKCIIIMLSNWQVCRKIGRCNINHLLSKSNTEKNGSLVLQTNKAKLMFLSTYNMTPEQNCIEMFVHKKQTCVFEFRHIHIFIKF